MPATERLVLKRASKFDNSISIDQLALNNEDIFKITGNNGFEVIPGMHRVNSQVNILVNNIIKDAGNYLLKFEDNTVAGLSFNYDRKESDLQYYSLEDLKNELKNNNLTNIKIIETLEKPISLAIKQMDEGIQFWKWFIMGALLFFLLEIVLLRIWK